MATITVWAFESARARTRLETDNATNAGTATSLEELNAIRNAHQGAYFGYWDDNRAMWIPYHEAQALMGDSFWKEFIAARNGQ